MRRALPLLAALAVATSAAAETRVEVPQDLGAQQVVVLSREFAVGGASGWHRHPGVEIGQVLSGAFELRTLGAARRYVAGESFVVPRDVTHNGVNVGTVPVRLAITYLVDKDAPLRSDAPDPNARR